MCHVMCYTVGGDIKLLRAEWFEVGSDKWYPLEEDVAKQIEEAHRSTAWRTKVSCAGKHLLGILQFRASQHYAIS